MKKLLFALYKVLLFLALTSCGSDSIESTEKGIAEGEIAKNRKALVEDSSKISTKTDNFVTPESLNRYAEMLDAYWAKEEGRKKRAWSYTCDTLVLNSNEDRKKAGFFTHFSYDTVNFSRLSVYNYSTKTASRGSFFQVIELADNKAATDMFNEMKTVELMVPFGLTKTANHIFVMNNKIYWMHFTSGISHRTADYKHLFYKAFNFKPEAPNLDSVSGMTYCQCIDEDADLHEINGTWKSVKVLNTYNDSVHWNKFEKANFPGISSMKLRLSKNKINVNDFERDFEIDYKTSKKFPDSYYYFKYVLEDYTRSVEISNMQDSEKSAFDSLVPKPYQNLMKKLAAKKTLLTEYQLNTKQGEYAEFHFTVLRLGDGEVYCEFKNKLFKLVKQ